MRSRMGHGRRGREGVVRKPRAETTPVPKGSGTGAEGGQQRGGDRRDQRGAQVLHTPNSLPHRIGSLRTCMRFSLLFHAQVHDISNAP